MTLKFIACCEYIKAKRQLLREPAIRKCGRNTRYGHDGEGHERLLIRAELDHRKADYLEHPQTAPH